MKRDLVVGILYLIAAILQCIVAFLNFQNGNMVLGWIYIVIVCIMSLTGVPYLYSYRRDKKNKMDKEE